MSDRSVEQVISDLDSLLLESASVTAEEIQINSEISKLREKLSRIQERKSHYKMQQRSLEKEKASAERMQTLRNEKEELERNFKKLRDEAEKLIADAPWLDRVFPWQKEGALQLAAVKRGLLADVRGMGKTLSSLAWRRAVGSKKTLVLTRRQYAKSFHKEVNYWEPNLDVIPLISADPMTRRIVRDFLKNHDEFIVIGNFEMWRRNDQAIEDLIKMKLDGIILDEAHQLKTFNSKTTQGFIKLAPEVPNLLEMTGTPVQNRPPELFAILHTLYPDIFPDEGAFKRDFCEKYGQNNWGWRPGGLETLTNKMRHFFVARTPEQVGHKVPPPAINEFELDFSGYPEQHEAYKLVAERSLAKLKGGKVLSIPGVLAVMTRLAQIVAWPGDLTLLDKETGDLFNFDIQQSVKIDWAEDLINELHDEDQRVVLFSRFKAPLYELHRRLLSKGITTALVTGDNKSTHDEVITDFDLKTAPEKPRYRVLLATYDTIGESVNLNAARHLIQFDRFWKPSRDDQAIGRIDRINSLDQATVYRAAVAGSIDEYMIKLIEEKTNIINEFSTAADMQQGLIAHLENSL